MSSLAGTTEKLRSLIKIGGIAAGALFLLYLFILGGIFMKNLLFPSAPELPEQSFGELPNIEFQREASPAVNYQVNTVSGELPTNLPSTMFVYKLSGVKPDLLALQNTRRLASSAGFNSSEIKLSDSLYQWTNPTTNAVIKFDINNNNFEINSDVTSIQNLLTNAVIPEEERIKQYVGNFLNSLGVDTNGLVFTNESFKYYHLSNGILVETENAFGAKIVRASLYNKTIVNELGEFSFVYDNPDTSLVNLLVIFPSSARMTVIGGESYNKVVTNENSEYPIKSPAEALEELKLGNGYLFNPQELNTIEITSVYLAYYLDKNTNEYAQPVYVFEGPASKAFVKASQFATSSAEIASE